MRNLQLPIIALGLFVVVMGFAAFGVSRVIAQVNRAPDQPVAFPHTVHVKAVQLDCLFCHRNAYQGAIANVPSVEQCMFCHQVVATDNPEVRKVINAYETGQPINWVRVHRVPDHVHFIHAPHIQAGFNCATCHGDVGSMQRVQQVRDLRMKDCIDCHRANNAPTECTVCHY